MNTEIQKYISDAWVCLRKHNQTIPDEVVDDFKKLLEEHYSQQQRQANNLEPYQKTGPQFDPQQLHTYYSNVRPLDDANQANYAVFDQYGNQTGNIIYMGCHEWRYLLDNFPAEKKFYSNNLPVITKDHFESDVLRTGLQLVPH